MLKMGAGPARLKPVAGSAGNGAAARCLATHLGLPVSTTHAIAGAIAGVGSIQRMKAVRWGIATNIVWAWVLTIPAAALIAFLSFCALHSIAGV
jgi:PiT family inorganic phosphate transporter